MTTCGKNLDFTNIRRRKNKSNKNSLVRIRSDNNNVLEIDKNNDSCDDMVNVTEYDDPNSPPEVCINIFDLMNLHSGISEKENVENFSIRSDCGYSSASPNSLCDSSHSTFRVTDTICTTIPSHNLSSPAHSPMHEYEEEIVLEKKKKMIFPKRYDDLLDLSHILKKTLVISCKKLNLDEFCKKNRFIKTGDHSVLMTPQPLEEPKFNPMIEHVRIDVDSAVSSTKDVTKNEFNPRIVLELNRTNELLTKVASNTTKKDKLAKEPNIITLEMLSAGLLKAKIADDNSNVSIKSLNAPSKTILKPSMGLLPTQPLVNMNTNLINNRNSNLEKIIHYVSSVDASVIHDMKPHSIPPVVGPLVEQLDICTLDGMSLSSEEISAILPNTVFSEPVFSNTNAIVVGDDCFVDVEKLNISSQSSLFSHIDNVKTVTSNVGTNISNQLDEEDIKHLIDPFKQVYSPTIKVDVLDTPDLSVPATQKVKNEFDIIKEMESVMMNAKCVKVSQPSIKQPNKGNATGRARMINTAPRSRKLPLEKIQNKSAFSDDNLFGGSDSGCSRYNAVLDCLFSSASDEFDFSDYSILQSDAGVEVKNEIEEEKETVSKYMDDVCYEKSPKEEDIFDDKFSTKIFFPKDRSKRKVPALTNSRKRDVNDKSVCIHKAEKFDPYPKTTVQQKPLLSKKKHFVSRKKPSIFKKHTSKRKHLSRTHPLLSRRKNSLKVKSHSVVEKASSTTRQDECASDLKKLSVVKSKNSKRISRHGDKLLEVSENEAQSAKEIHTLQSNDQIESMSSVPEAGQPTCCSLPKKITLKISRKVKKNKTSFSILRARSNSESESFAEDVNSLASENDTKQDSMSKKSHTRSNKTKNFKLPDSKPKEKTAPIIEKSSKKKCITKINSVCTKDSVIKSNTLPSDFDSRSKVTEADVEKKSNTSPKEEQNKASKKRKRLVFDSREKVQAHVKGGPALSNRKHFSRKFVDRKKKTQFGSFWKQRKKKDSVPETRLKQTKLPFVTEMTSEESTISSALDEKDSKSAESNKAPEKAKIAGESKPMKKTLDTNGTFENVEPIQEIDVSSVADDVMEVDTSDVAHVDVEDSENPKTSDNNLLISNGSHADDIVPKDDNVEDPSTSTMEIAAKSSDISESVPNELDFKGSKTKHSNRTDEGKKVDESPCESAFIENPDSSVLETTLNEISHENQKLVSTDPYDKNQNITLSKQLDQIPDSVSVTVKADECSESKSGENQSNEMLNNSDKIETDTTHSESENKSAEKKSAKQTNVKKNKTSAHSKSEDLTVVETTVSTPNSELRFDSKGSTSVKKSSGKMSKPTEMSTTSLPDENEKTPGRSQRQKVSRQRYSPPAENKVTKPATPASTGKSTIKVATPTSPMKRSSSAKTPTSDKKAPLVSTPASGKKKFSAEDVIKPFSLGWMREVVHRATSGTNKKGKAVDIYYFTPEGTKLRSMPEVNKYLAEHKSSGLAVDNFTFAKETIYRHPFEKERGARVRFGDEPSPIVATPSKSSKHKIEPESSVSGTAKSSKQQKTQAASLLKADSTKRETERTPLETKKNAPKTARKSAKPVTNVVPKDKDVVSEVHPQTPSADDSSARLSGEDIEGDVQQLRVSSTSEKRPRKSTKRFMDEEDPPSKKAKVKITIPKKIESTPARPCTGRCPAAFHQQPTLQCKICLCMFHPECVNKDADFSHFICGSCQDKKSNASSPDPNSDGVYTDCVSIPSIVPEVSLQMWPDDRPIRTRSMLATHDISVSKLPPPPPLQRAPEPTTSFKKTTNAPRFPNASGANSAIRNLINTSPGMTNRMSPVTTVTSINQQISSSSFTITSSSPLLYSTALSQSVIPISTITNAGSAMQPLPLFANMPPLQLSSTLSHPAPPPLFLFTPQLNSGTIFPTSQIISRAPPAMVTSNDMRLRLLLPSKGPVPIGIRPQRPCLQRPVIPSKPMFAIVRDATKPRFMPMNFPTPNNKTVFAIRKQVPATRLPITCIGNIPNAPQLKEISTSTLNSVKTDAAPFVSTSVSGKTHTSSSSSVVNEMATDLPTKKTLAPWKKEDKPKISYISESENEFGDPLNISDSSDLSIVELKGSSSDEEKKTPSDKKAFNKQTGKPSAESNNSSTKYTYSRFNKEFLDTSDRKSDNNVSIKQSSKGSERDEEQISSYKYADESSDIDTTSSSDKEDKHLSGISNLKKSGGLRATLRQRRLRHIYRRKVANTQSDSDSSEEPSRKPKKPVIKPKTAVQTSSKAVECHMQSYSFPTFPKNPDMNTFTVGYECLNAVFKKLNINDLLQISQVCKSWQCLATQRFLWQHISLKDIFVNDWIRCTEALKKNGTKALNLGGILNKNLDMWRDFINGLNNLTTLEHLTFSHVPPFVIEAVADKLPLLQRLECFCLTTTQEKPDIWTTTSNLKFFNLRFLKKLKRLKIRSAGGLTSDNEPTELRHLPDLQHLSLTSLKKFPSSHFNFVPYLSNLVSLELGDCSTWMKENYMNLGKLVKLQQLRLENGGGFDIGLADALQLLEKLQELELMKFIVPENLGDSLENLALLKKFILWPDNSDEAAQINYNAYQSVIKLRQISYFCWGIISPDDCIPLLPMLKSLNDSEDSEENESPDIHYEDLFDRLCAAMPDAKVEMKCISLDFLNEYCSIQR